MSCLVVVLVGGATEAMAVTQVPLYFHLFVPFVNKSGTRSFSSLRPTPSLFVFVNRPAVARHI